MKIVIIGAGSQFGSRLSVDILSREPLREATIALCDINAGKLEATRGYVQRVIDAHQLPATCEASTERTEVLAGADFVVLSVAIGGPAYFDHPYEAEMKIPDKYGIKQTVGDTLGPGGIFRTLRTAPEMLAMMDDVNRLAPGAMVLNYTNPMCMLTWALSERLESQIVGLCHSVQHTSKMLAEWIGAPYEEVSYWVAGINHMAWFLEFQHNGVDALPRLWEAIAKPGIKEQQIVRVEVMEHFGTFVTESSKHMSEYIPWYQHRKAFMDETYPHMYDRVRERRSNWIEDMGIKAEQAASTDLIRSHEYASGIVEAVLTDAPMRFNGNVMNEGIITNLTEGCCVEVPCMVDRLGVHPCHTGALPPQLAALCQSNVSVQALVVEAVRQRRLEPAYHALLLDPITGANCSLEQARALFDEMVEAEGELLSWYQK